MPSGGHSWRLWLMAAWGNARARRRRRWIRPRGGWPGRPGVVATNSPARGAVRARPEWCPACRIVMTVAMTNNKARETTTFASEAFRNTARQRGSILLT